MAKKSVSPKAEEVAVEEKAKASISTKEGKKKAKKKDKKPSVIVKKTKEIGSELKKISWPSFAKVVKNTGVVLVVVLMFTLVLLGIDRLLFWLFYLLTSGLV
jgi:preprotein translocase subunit SecE